MNIVLIACAKKKKLGIYKAKDLYDSDLFSKAYTYAEKIGNKIFILSAKYGLLDPEAEVEYYNETLNSKSKTEIKTWSVKVISSLLDQISKDDVITFIAGKNYRLFLEPYLIANGYKVEVPLRNLGIGKQLKALSEL